MTVTTAADTMKEAADITVGRKEEGSHMKYRSKRFVAIMVAAMLVTVLATGCGKKQKTEKILEDTQESVEEVESVTGKIKLEMKVKQDNIPMNVNVDMDFESGQKAQASHIWGNLNADFGVGESQIETEIYRTKDGDKFVTYHKMDGQWYKQEGDDTEELLVDSAYKDLEELADKLTADNKDSEVNGKKCHELTGTLQGKALENMVKSGELGALGIYDFINGETLSKADIPCTMAIYEKDEKIAYIELDMKEPMLAIYEEQVEDLEGIDVLVCRLKIEFQEYNSVKAIEVPQDIIESAVE